jgi:hypothetical protein
MPKFTKEIIEAAITGFENQKQNIDARIAELRTMLNGAGTPAGARSSAGKTKRRLSPEAIQRMREGQKRRWAAAKSKSAAAPAKAPKPKRKLSAAGRKAIVAALKKRWAAKRAANA